MPPASSKPPMPDTVRYAFYLMLTGAALAAIGIVAALVQIGTIRDSVRDNLRDNPSSTNVDTAVNFTIGSIVVIGLIGVGLWIWMAFANRAGQNWARIIGTVFFGIAVLFTLIGLAASATSMGSSSTAVGTVINVLSLLVGLAVVILLWNGRSTPYFKPEQAAGYGYQPPGQQPYGNQPYGGQPPGQPYGTPPPPGPGPGPGPGPQPPTQPGPPEGGPGGMTPPQ